ncbi:hypothetical protein lerEdw1_009545 [Lerista edwardsae]|nr:hypothetical protein lerEdw1_009545 [Lerista edwardsae]
MSSSDEETLSERSYRSERSCKSERSYRSERSGSLSPCPPGDTLPWNLPLHEQKKRKSQDSVLDPAERAVVRVAVASLADSFQCHFQSGSDSGAGPPRRWSPALCPQMAAPYLGPLASPRLSEVPAQPLAGCCRGSSGPPRGAGLGSPCPGSAPAVPLTATGRPRRHSGWPHAGAAKERGQVGGRPAWASLTAAGGASAGKRRRRRGVAGAGREAASRRSSSGRPGQSAARTAASCRLLARPAGSAQRDRPPARGSSLPLRRAEPGSAMAGYVPGQLPLNRSQEKEFVQAYEDVLERYKGGPAGGGGAPALGGRRGEARGAVAESGAPAGILAAAARRAALTLRAMERRGGGGGAGRLPPWLSQFGLRRDPWSQARSGGLPACLPPPPRAAGRSIFILSPRLSRPWLPASIRPALSLLTLLWGLLLAGRAHSPPPRLWASGFRGEGKGRPLAEAQPGNRACSVGAALLPAGDPAEVLALGPSSARRGASLLCFGGAGEGDVQGGPSRGLQVLGDGGGSSCTSSGTLRDGQGSVSGLASTQILRSGSRKEEEEEEAKPVVPVLASGLTTTVTSTA